MPLASADRFPPTPQAVYANTAMLATMNDNMVYMRQQIDRIRETTDPSERERLIQDHIRLMTWQMEMAKHMTDAEWQYLESTRANPDESAAAEQPEQRALRVVVPTMFSALGAEAKSGSTLVLNGSMVSNKQVELED